MNDLTTDDVLALKKMALVAKAAADDIKSDALRLETFAVIKAACAAIRKVELK